MIAFIKPTSSVEQAVIIFGAFGRGTISESEWVLAMTLFFDDRGRQSCSTWCTFCGDGLVEYDELDKLVHYTEEPLVNFIVSFLTNISN